MTELEGLDIRGPYPGHLYAVGVGPGSPDLLTLRAAHIVKNSDVLICPRSSRSGQGMALASISPWIKGQKIIEAVYPMRRDEIKTRAFWGDMAEQAHNYLENKYAVAQITLGDPLLYSTSCYFLEEMQRRLPAGNIHVVPGIAAFQAVSARLKKALAVQEDRMLLMPGTEEEQVRSALECCETLILYKAGHNLEKIRMVLEEEGVVQDASLVCYAEQHKEFICRDMEGYQGELPGYLASIIVHVRRRKWRKD